MERAEAQSSMIRGSLRRGRGFRLLIDEDTFVETDMFLEHRCTYFGMDRKKQEGDGVITGYGKINGRPVCVYAQDFYRVRRLHQ